jgi:hypothetical protein
VTETSCVYTLRNLDTGSETRYRSLGDALDAVDSVIDEGDAWDVLEIDSLRIVLPRSDRRAGGTGPVAEGRGHNNRPAPKPPSD